MRVFTTGASGWIGSAVVPALQAAGHEVVGLARSAAAADRLAAAGVAVHRGDLDDLPALRAGAEEADAVVHLGFKHDFADFAGAGRTERAAVETFGDVLAGTGRPLLLASGIAGAAPGRLLTEDDPSPFTTPDAPRGASETLALALRDRGVPAVALRFAPTVHGDGDHGFTAELVRVARERGVAGYVGDGANRWPAVHRSDAARLVVRALERAADVPVVHAVAEEGIAARDIAAAVGRVLDVPTAPVDPDDAVTHFGWIGRFFAIDMPASSALTRTRLGWDPTGPTLLDDLAAGAYPAAA